LNIIFWGHKIFNKVFTKPIGILNLNKVEIVGDEDLSILLEINSNINIFINKATIIRDRSVTLVNELAK
jgi:hypothetical protein